MKNTKEFEALKALANSNFAMLEDGTTVYMTPTGEVRDTDTRLLLPADRFRAALYLKNKTPSEGGGGLPTGGEPHKVLTTDANGNVTWEDKLCYKTVEHVEILPETTIVYDDSLYFNVEPNVPFGNAEKCTVVFNGEEYSCNVQRGVIPGAFDGAYLVAVGNAALAQAGEDTGEPFLVASSPNVQSHFTIFIKTKADFTISISADIAEVKAIPSEYIQNRPIYCRPDGGNLFHVYEDEGLTTPLAFEEGVKRLLNGCLLAIITDDGVYYEKSFGFKIVKELRAVELLFSNYTVFMAFSDTINDS